MEFRNENQGYLESSSGEKAMGRMATAIKLARNPWVIGSATLVIFVAKDAATEHLLRRVPMKDIGQTLWNAVWAFSDNPLVEIVLVAVAIWMFSKGVNQVIAAQNAKIGEAGSNQMLREEMIEQGRQAALKETEHSLSSIRGAVGDAMRVSTLISLAYVQQLNSAPLKHSLANLDKVGRDHKDLICELNKQPGDRVKQIFLSQIGSACDAFFRSALHSINHARKIAGDGVWGFEPQQVFPKAKPTDPSNSMAGRDTTFYPELNAQFLFAQQNVLDAVDTECKRLELMGESYEQGIAVLIESTKREAMELCQKGYQPPSSTNC